MVARPEETRDRAEHAAGLVAPGDAAAGLERRLHLGLIVEQRRHQVEAAHHVDRTVLVGEHHRLLGRQGYLPVYFTGILYVGQLWFFEHRPLRRSVYRPVFMASVNFRH